MPKAEERSGVDTRFAFFAPIDTIALESREPSVVLITLPARA